MAAQLTRRVLRVFLASPGDVGEERNAAERVAADLNKIIGRHLQWQIDLHKWEDKSPGMGRPQSIINPDVDQCDLFVGLLWEHWGHATGIYSSGFEEEFERAKARYQKTGEPQIWLAFKQPRPDKLTDPGPQLSGVLSFKEKQIASNEVLFSHVKDTNEWERDFSHWLTEHVLDLSQVAQPTQEQRPITLGPAAQPADSKEAVEPQDLLTGFKGKVPEQIAQEFQILGKLIENNQLEFAPGDEKMFKEFDVARFHLLSSTWMSKRYTGEILGTHEINQLYRYRSKLQTAAPERFLLLRTLVNDSADVVPGWFWFRELKDENLWFLLFGLANDDTLPHLRAQAIQTIGSAEIEPPDQRWDLLPVADQEMTVRWAAYDYLGRIANLSALPLLEMSIGDENDIAAATAYRARLHILARLDPEQGFLDLISRSDYASDEMLRLIEPSLGKIKTATLNEGLTSPHQRTRELSATELARRGDLSIADAEKLTKDIFIPIRKIGFEELIRRGKAIDLDKIKESFSEAEDPGLRFGRRQRFSDLFYGAASPSPPDYRELADSVILEFFRTLPYDELQKSIDWLGPYGRIAYRCLASSYDGAITTTVRTDIKEGFQRIRNATIERFEAEYGAKGAEQLRESIEKLDEYIRNDFLEAALVGLAIHAEPSDLAIARNYLSHTRAGVKGAALEILCRFGTPDDIPALITISNEAVGELRRKAAACALRLSPNAFEMAETFTTSRTAEIVAIGFRWLLEDSSSKAKQFFENLLSHESDGHRERAIYYLTKGLGEAELQKLLEDYLARENYYYNVATWLDRLLYAPPPLAAMYKQRLAQKM